MLLLSSLAKKFIVMRSQLSIKKGKKRKKKREFLGSIGLSSEQNEVESKQYFNFLVLSYESQRIRTLSYVYFFLTYGEYYIRTCSILEVFL